MNQEANTIVEKAQGSQQKVFNPFPGLRPFTIEESHLFFGREGQSDEILQNLSKNRFVAVIGASGSGKSSLMYCGLTPILYGGFITEAGSKWNIVATRPGSAPIENMANALIKSSLNKGNKKNDNTNRAIIHSILESSSFGLIEAIKYLDWEEDENVLLLVDQFEELFRFKKRRGDMKAYDESLAFVKLLLEAVEQKKAPIYIVLTMRSDFIGECAQYQDLTKLINDSYYLIPQMTRDNLKEAIEGPIAVGGGEISPRLIHQLLNDVGDNPDQLPILQHALMRTWEYWVKHRKDNEVIDIPHYEAIGRMEHALSEHANEAYNELTPEGRGICESMFKTLTEQGGDNRGIRRPSSIDEIISISNSSREEVVEVVERFRLQGRSFVTPSVEFELNDESIIDISHESLMRIWDRLKVWVDEEANAVQMYLRLAEAGGLYQDGKTGLWKPPDLHLAVNWRQEKNPTLAWAKRYEPAFERTISFIETSEKEYELEEQNKIKQHKRQLRRSRMFALVLGSITIISLGILVYTYILQIETKKQQQIAVQKSKEASEQKALADINAEEARKSAMEASEQRKFAEEKALEAEQQKILALENFELAKEQEKMAKYQSWQASKQKKLAENKAQEALEQKNLAESASSKAYKLRMLSISQSMAVKASQMISDKQLKGLIGLQSYVYNLQYQGNEFNPDIYAGLFASYINLEKESGYVYKGHTDAVRSVAFQPYFNIVYSVGSDGKLIQWNTSAVTKTPVTFYTNSFVNRAVVVSGDGKWLACATDKSVIQLFDTRNLSKAPIQIDGHEGVVWSIEFTKDNKYIISSGSDNTIRVWDMEKGVSTAWVENVEKVKSIAVSPDGLRVIGASQNGKIYSWNLLKLNKQEVIYDNGGSAIHVVEFNAEGNLIAFGDSKGRVGVFDVSRKKLIATLAGHTARISDLKFSPDGNQLATASYDKSIRLWQTLDFDEQPIILRGHDGWVLSLAYSTNGDKLISGAVNNELREWYTESKYLAKQMKKKITRNFTKNEWSRYVASDIDYVETLKQKVE